MTLTVVFLEERERWQVLSQKNAAPKGSREHRDEDEHDPVPLDSPPLPAAAVVLSRAGNEIILVHPALPAQEYACARNGAPPPFPPRQSSESGPSDLASRSHASGGLRNLSARRDTNLPRPSDSGG